MAQPVPLHATLDEGRTREAIPFALNSPTSVNVAVDRMIASRGDPGDAGSRL